MRFVSRYVVYGAWRFDDLWTFEILGNRMILDEVSHTTNFSSYVTTKMLAVYDIRPSPFHQISADHAQYIAKNVIPCSVRKLCLLINLTSSKIPKTRIQKHHR